MKPPPGSSKQCQQQNPQCLTMGAASKANQNQPEPEEVHMPVPEPIGYTKDPVTGEEILHTSEGAYHVQPMHDDECGMEEECTHPENEPLHLFNMLYVEVPLHAPCAPLMLSDEDTHAQDCWCQEAESEPRSQLYREWLNDQD